MSVTPAYYLSLAESYLKEMLKDSVVWRSIVQSPNTDWASLSTLIGLGTALEAPAAAKILSGRVESVERPWVVIRHFDGNHSSKQASSGWEEHGVIYLGFEIPIPETYQANSNDAYLDSLNKLGGVQDDLKRMPLQYPYLHITRMDITAFGQEPLTDDNGEFYYVWELAIHHIGSPF